METFPWSPSPAQPTMSHDHLVVRHHKAPTITRLSDGRHQKQVGSGDGKDRPRSARWHKRKGLRGWGRTLDSHGGQGVAGRREASHGFHPYQSSTPMKIPVSTSKDQMMDQIYGLRLFSLETCSNQQSECSIWEMREQQTCTTLHTTFTADNEITY